jgi:predicted nucleic acid-binding protein
VLALDTNIIVYALSKADERHHHVMQWLQDAGKRVCISPVSVAETLRVLTHPKFFLKPVSLTHAVGALNNFVAYFSVELLEENKDWWQELPDLAGVNPGLRGNEIYDARIALCLKFNGIKKIGTYDADFKKYPFLEVINPQGN